MGADAPAAAEWPPLGRRHRCARGPAAYGMCGRVAEGHTRAAERPRRSAPPSPICCAACRLVCRAAPHRSVRFAASARTPREQHACVMKARALVGAAVAPLRTRRFADGCAAPPIAARSTARTAFGAWRSRDRLLLEGSPSRLLGANVRRRKRRRWRLPVPAASGAAYAGGKGLARHVLRQCISSACNERRALDATIVDEELGRASQVELESVRRPRSRGARAPCGATPSCVFHETAAIAYRYHVSAVWAGVLRAAACRGACARRRI